MSSTDHPGDGAAAGARATRPPDPATTGQPVRVLLVDDHRLVLESLARVLDEEPDIRIVGTATSVAEARDAAREPVDVVLMDFLLPDGTGADATRAIKARWPSARVIMLTAVDDDETVLESIQAGADGYLTKDKAIDEVVATVRAANAGETLLPRDVIVTIAKRVAEARERQAERPPVEALTPRELEVLRALVEGLSTPDICERLAHHAEHPAHPRAEHHGQAPRALEARGGVVRAPLSPGGAAAAQLRPAGDRAVRQPGRQRPLPAPRRSVILRSATRRSGSRWAPQRGHRCSSAGRDSSGAAVSSCRPHTRHASFGTPLPGPRRAGAEGTGGAYDR